MINLPLIELRLQPIKELSLIHEKDGISKWELLGRDPQFLLTLPKSFKAGQYRIRIELVGAEPQVSQPCLSVDMGGGFTHGHVPLWPEDPLGTMLVLRRGAKALRFDVSSAPGTVSLGKVTLEMVRSRGWLDYTRRTRYLARKLSSPTKIRQTTASAIRVIRQGGFAGVRYAIARNIGFESDFKTGDRSYKSWIEHFDSFGEIDLQNMRAAMAQFAAKPLVSIVMPVYNTPQMLLIDAIESALAQVYPHWELCIADDASSALHIRQILDEYSQRDERIKVVFRHENGHISQASNSALELAKGEWIAFLDHDDLLRPNSLFEAVSAINARPQAKLLYSDEDKLDEEGERCDPYFKPDWNYELFLSHNLITHLALYRADMMKAVGGFREGFDGAQDYDLALRIIELCEDDEIVHIPQILYHWRRVQGSTALSSDEKPYAMLAGERALNDHLARTDRKGKAKMIGIGFRTTYEIPEPMPLVSIIIPTKDRIDLLDKCVSSILEKTDYSNFEIMVINNNSEDDKTHAWFDNAIKNRRITVHNDPGDFNYSRLNNDAAKVARGQFLLLMNNDIEVISPGWLTEMVGVCAQPNVGAVGARLWYPNNTLQHGGVIIGLGGVAGHVHSGLPKGHPGYVGRAVLRHEVSAVTAACLLTRREAYEAVGGLDEKQLKVAYNDIDYCLNLRSAGWKIVWTPFAELYHYESASRGYEITEEKRARFEREINVMKKRWGDWIERDPAYNPNLSLFDTMFGLAFPPRSRSVANTSNQSSDLPR